MATGGCGRRSKQTERQWQEYHVWLGNEGGGQNGGTRKGEERAGWRRESGCTVCPVVVVVTGHLRHDNPPIDLRFD